MIDPPRSTHGDCQGKQAFPSKAKALAIEHQRERRPGALRRKGALVPYRCPHCHQWHLGHRNQFMKEQGK